MNTFISVPPWAVEFGKRCPPRPLLAVHPPGTSHRREPPRWGRRSEPGPESERLSGSPGTPCSAYCGNKHTPESQKLSLSKEGQIHLQYLIFLFRRCIGKEFTQLQPKQTQYSLCVWSRPTCKETIWPPLYSQAAIQLSLLEQAVQSGSFRKLLPQMLPWQWT